MKMVHQRVARRYARALKDLATEQGQLDQVESDLKRVMELLRDNADWRRVWEHQRIDKAVKRRLVESVLEAGSRLTRNFLLLLVEKRREAILESAVAEFVVMANEERDIVDVEVRTARALGDAERELLSRRISEYIGKQVRLTEVSAPELLGGVVARVGDMVMDGSVITRLQRLQSHLRAARLPDEG